MTDGTGRLRHALIPCVLLAVTALAFAQGLRAPTPPLKERVNRAETVFLGKVADRIVEGGWVRASLVVEEPLWKAERGKNVPVIWTKPADTGLFMADGVTFDANEGARGVAILTDKHEGRYWLREDKFEDPKKLDEVKALVQARLREALRENMEMKRLPEPVKPVSPDAK